MAGYERAARAYHVVHTGRGKDYADEARQIEAIVRQFVPDARSLLDVACGGGTWPTWPPRSTLWPTTSPPPASSSSEGWLTPDEWIPGGVLSSDCGADEDMAVARVIRSRAEGPLSVFDMDWLIASRDGIELVTGAPAADV